MFISSLLNIIFKMTTKVHWGISLLLSLFVSIIVVGILSIGPQ